MCTKLRLHFSTHQDLGMGGIPRNIYLCGTHILFSLVDLLQCARVACPPLINLKPRYQLPTYTSLSAKKDVINSRRSWELKTLFDHYSKIEILFKMAPVWFHLKTVP